jgi:hypothetical protein
MRTFLKLAGILLALALAIAGCSSPTGGGGGGPSGSTETYAVTVDSAITGGSVTVSPGSGTAGTTITITVTPDNNKALKAGFPKATTGDGTEIAPDFVSPGEFTFTLPAAAVTVTAKFDDVTPGNHLIGIPAFSNGSVTSNPATSAASGTNPVTLTIVPAEGYQLKTIGVTKTEDLITPVSLSGSGDTRTFTMPAYDVTVSAEFEPKSYTIAKDTMTNGTVTFVTPALYGSTVTLTAVPESNYRLKAAPTVYKTGTPATTVTSSGSGNNWSFEMPAYNVTVSAEFEKIPPGGELLTLNNIPLVVTGQVAVLLFPEDDFDIPDVVGIGTLTGVPGSGSVTVNLHEYTGNLGSPLGDPWTKNAEKYLILIGSGTPPDFDYSCFSPDVMIIPGNNIIDASGFEFDGPSGPPVGHITGTLSISVSPGTPTVDEIYINAYQQSPSDWRSRDKALGPSLNTNFDIPLYGPGDENGMFAPGTPVEIHVVIIFIDETLWHLYFNNGGFGWSINHDDTTDIIPALSDTIPDTEVVTGSLGGVSIPSGQLDYVRVGLHSPVVGSVPGADLNMKDWVSWPWDWKIRIDSTAKVGMWVVSAGSKSGSHYSKVLDTFWTGQTAVGNLGSINFTVGDAGYNSPSFVIDSIYRDTYTGTIDTTPITLTVGEYQLSWSGGAGNLAPVFTPPSGNITGGTWAYVYKYNDSAKVGFIVSTASEKNIYLGTKATAAAASGHGITIDLSDISFTAPNIEASAP